MAPRVLVFGLPRTGTQSLLDALELLGFNKTYHMRNVEKSGHIDDWIALLDQKYNQTTTEVDLDRLKRLVDDCEATADFPSSIFFAELMQVYPEAKVIITPRVEDDWIRSMSTTLIYSHNKPDADVKRPMRPLAERYHTYCWQNDFASFGRDFYRKYLQEVRRLAEGRAVLEYRPGDGWESLCAFLGYDVPDVPFPRNDDLAPYKQTAGISGEAPAN